jgi:hypothetical protein
MKLGMNGFLNGVPVITLNKKIHKTNLLFNKHYKLLKEQENDYNENNISQEILKEFNTNKKNFFKVRKDIVEESQENEDFTESENASFIKKVVRKRKDEKEVFIEFPLIFRYFDKSKKRIMYNKNKRLNMSAFN